MTALGHLQEMDFEQAQWLFPMAVTVHNLEEAAWLPAWSQHAGAWHPPVGASEFRFTVAVLTAMAYGVTYTSVKGGPGSLGVYVLTGSASVLLVNVVFPHLAATVLQRRYAPGVVSGVAINAPVMFYLLTRAFRERYVSGKGLAVAAATVGAIVVGLIPLLFRLGRRVCAAQPPTAAGVLQP